MIWKTTEVWLNVGSPSSELIGKNVSLSFMRLRQWLNTRQPVRDFRDGKIVIVNSQLYTVLFSEGCRGHNERRDDERRYLQHLKPTRD